MGLPSGVMNDIDMKGTSQEKYAGSTIASG